MVRLLVLLKNNLLSAVKNRISVIAGIILFYVVLETAGITCPILFLFGISCAGCGMSRAWVSLLCGDLTAAVFYHPLFWVPPLALIIYFLRDRMSLRLQTFLTWFGCILFMTVYAVRMADAEDMIVVFRPENGMIGRAIRFLGGIGLT